MTRLVWVTDPHLDHAPVEAIARFRKQLHDASPDAVVVSGDISESIHLLSALDWLRSAVDAPLWFCLGNHDFYYDSIERVRDAVEEWCGRRDGVRYLTRSEPFEIADGVGLLGHDGWADGRTESYERSIVVMHDARLIADLAGLDKRARWDVMMKLADESALDIERQLSFALERWQHLFVVTHVPPFREACWHAGKISDDHWAPHFTNIALGQRLSNSAAMAPDRRITVLCGHTHGGGEFTPAPNLRVLTGAAEYGSPAIVQIFDLPDTPAKPPHH